MISSKEIPKTMKVLSLKEVGNLCLEERPVPTIKEDEVLLEIKNCGICSSDIERIFVNGTYHFPTVPGHEFSGQVVGVNEKDSQLLNKKASVFPLIPCRKCSACAKEEYAQCSNYNYFGSRCDGGYSEYLAVPKWNLVFFEDIDYDIAALCEPASVAIHSLKRVNIDSSKKVLVMGSGTIGLLISLFAKNKGLDVYVGVRSEKSREFALELGLNTIDTNNLEEEVKSATSGEGFDYIFEAVGTNQTISQSILACANFAKIVVIGNPKEDLKLEKNVYWKILRKQLTLTGTWNSSYSEKVNDWREALEFMKQNTTVFKKIITNKYTLDEYNEAFNILRDKTKFKTKVMFKVGE